MTVTAGEQAAAWLERLSLGERVAQLMIPRPSSWQMSPRQYVDELGVGGLIVDRNTYREPRQLAEYIGTAQRAAIDRNGVPLLVCCDQEGGHVRFMRSVATDVPSNMGLGATGDPRSAGQAAAILASELVAVGVNWNLAPVADVNNNPENPVIGTRSYADDPSVVASFVAEAIAAIQHAGLLACAKHFPGHGDTIVDSHVGLPHIAHDRDHLERLELVPFRAAIGAGVASMMTAHVLVPALDAEWIGTLSAPILTDLLRRDMGFDGIIVTDALEMRGMADLLSESAAAVESIRAGADALLTARRADLNQETFRALLQAVESGRIPQDRFDTAVRRLLEAKARHVLPLGPVDPERAAREVGSAGNKRRALDLARKSITVVRDNVRALPLRRDLGERLVLLNPVGTEVTMMEKWTSGASVLGQAFVDQAPGAVEVALQYPVDETTLRTIERAVDRAEVVVLATLNAILDADQVRLAEIVRDRAPNARLVVVALRGPYDLLRMTWIETFVCAYTSVEPSVVALAEVLFGQTPPVGRLPVELPGLFPRGHAR
jgi:beta-N-acetylhexosaminidase